MAVSIISFLSIEHIIKKVKLKKNSNKEWTIKIGRNTDLKWEIKSWSLAQVMQESFFVQIFLLNLKDISEIILIDRNDYHQLMQEIHLVASGFRTAEQLKIPISSLIYGKKIKFIQSNVKKILPDKRTIILDSRGNRV